ncbi:hypothetical protein HAX54_034252 [Datura stramonium]|uniref:Uncharacterized protein n=1 Tax=Datura stramonium TaxID=4076 RepID=A0ABS8SEY4_DATST|nr:hypothetical protein [Datura stramonium]
MSRDDLFDTTETRNMPSQAGNDFDHDHNKNKDGQQLELLECLREIYMKRRELIKKMNYEESVEVFKKLKVSIRKKKKKLKTQTTIKRSLSVGDEMRHERAKVFSFPLNKVPILLVGLL